MGATFLANIGENAILGAILIVNRQSKPHETHFEHLGVQAREPRNSGPSVPSARPSVRPSAPQLAHSKKN